MTEETIENQLSMETSVDDILLNDKMDLDITETINFINNKKPMDVDQENNINIINQIGNDKQNTENVDDEVVINKTKTKKLTIVDSDSEVEVNTKTDSNGNNNEILDNDSNSCESFIKKTLKNFPDDKDDVKTLEVKRTKKRITIIDSDDDSNSASGKVSNVSEREDEENNLNQIDNGKKRNRLKLYDSDSDEEITSNFNENKQISSDDEISNGKKQINSDSETSNYAKKDENPIVFSSVHKSNLSSLCDPDSSEDEEINVRRHNFNEYIEPSKPILKYKKSRVQEEKPKKMTGKDAMQQRREIQSESQRMIREQNVSLPYHKSKSYTLKEFLEKRSKLSNIVTLTKSKPTHLNMKMTPKQLEEMAKKLEQREKELDEFYKSESEDEMEDVKSNNERDEGSTVDDKISNEEKNEEKIDNVVSMDEVEINKTDAVEEQVLKKDSNEDKIIEQNDGDKIDDINGDLLKSTEKSEEQLDKIDKDTNEENIDCHNDVSKKDDEKVEEIKPQPEKSKTSKILERLKKLNPLLALKSDFKPRISGNSKDIIILDEDVEKTRAINELKKRFIAQNSIKPVHTKDESHIMSVDSSVLKHEAAKVLIDHDDDTRVVELKPGEKLKKLRHELELQMAKKRRELYEKQQKELEEAKKMEEETYEGEKEDCGLFDEEEEEEMTESESSEDEEDDIEIIEKPRKKSDFVDDEADESDRETDDSDDSEDEEEIEHNEINNTKKEMKRIINTFNEEDSEDETDRKNETLESLNTTQSVQNDMFDNDNNILLSDDEEIPLYQKENPNKTPSRAIIESKSELNLTPTVLTALEGMASTSKRALYESPAISLSLPLPQEPSPLRLNPGVKTKLFESNDGEDSLSHAYDELEALCSGKFTGAVESNPKLTTQDENELLGVCFGTFDISGSNLGNKKVTTGLKLNTQEKELLGISSGKFNVNVPEFVDDSQDEVFDVNIPGVSSQNKENIDKELSEISTTINIELENDSSSDSFLDKDKGKETGTFRIDLNDNSQDMKLTLDDDDSVLREKEMKTKKSDIFSIDDDPILKETLDELTEKENDAKQTKIKKSDTIRKLVILSSDEEIENNELMVKRKKKKKRKRKGLEFSDDEDSDVESITNEEIELDINTEEVNYDSEENEVEYDENEEVVVKSAKNFFEAEAELSESEWGSADEDERGLDELEIEDGDAEQFNEIKLQNELGKIHMRQVLDQDNREVRLIQELLLEDGELHGAKRERKFRWKNADSMTWNDDQPKDEEDEENDEVENELEWRKMRHEREVFLEEQRTKAMRSVNEIELLTGDSQILKIGHELLKKSQDVNNDNSTKVPQKIESFSFLNKRGFRGSFLARSENTLSRLAEMTKVTEKEFFMSSGPKNSRNFVFTSVSKTEEIIEEGEENDKKRKAAEGTPTVLKKMRISENSPVAGRSNKKSKKSLFKPS